jgi:hypothetical protein
LNCNVSPSYCRYPIILLDLCPAMPSRYATILLHRISSFAAAWGAADKTASTNIRMGTAADLVMISDRQVAWPVNWSRVLSTIKALSVSRTFL